MASVVDDPNGRRRILFVGSDSKRRTIRLGKIDRKSADSICRHVEALQSAKVSGQPVARDTASWLASIGDALRGKLAAVGLIAERDTRQTVGLKGFFTAYAESRPELAANTRRNLFQAVRYLSDFFGADRKLGTVTVGDAVRFASHMRANYASATANRTIVHGKQFFKAAERDGLVDSNPFRDVRGGTMSNPERMHFVPPEQTQQLIEACPNGEWRLIVALARYGGLRTPSEHLALTWADIDWERDRFLVRSPKTGPRWVPMFPELRPHLEEAFERAEAGAVHVITRTRDASTNWRTTFVKIIFRAGLLPWEKPFQNLRATRETELAQSYPLHVVTSWIGNSVPVAAKHYLQVTDADFARAAKGGAESGARVAQKAAQTAADAERPEQTEIQKPLGNEGVCLLPSAPRLLCPDVQYPVKESNLRNRAS